jgi:SAM-dependent methyltransferase
MKSGKHTDLKTISDFGEQWTTYRDNSGFYGSTDLFMDAFGTFVSLDEIRGKRVGDIGSGSGRIVNMLLAAGAAEVVAVEPSDAMEALRENTRNAEGRVRYVHATGEAIGEAASDLDFIVSYGVLHHITDPSPVVRAALVALKPGGKFLAWVYGREGNALYLKLAEPMRVLTTRLPPVALRAISRVMTRALDVYVPACERFPLPLARYMTNVIAKLDREKRYLVVYDQLNPAYAKYYREREARELFENAGFSDVRLYHRHGYSWTISGTKSAEGSGSRRNGPSS